LNSSRLRLEEYKKGILGGDRVILAKAITLMESTLPEDQRLAGDVLDSVLAKSGNSLRIGITGAPGVGKSTFIESFGKALIRSGKKVAVLTIDPTSQVSGGSILGDKTRMNELARNPDAFIRPSPSGRTLGGVGSHTREAILLCEAAGFGFVIVETVGTGQSETAIKKMADFFLLLIQPGAGDELQGIKKGIVEMADAIAVTKADGDNIKSARATQADYQHALHLSKGQPSGWVPKVITCSAINNTGLDDILIMIEQFRQQVSASGHFESNRRDQHTAWFHEHFEFLLSLDPRQSPEVLSLEKKLEDLIRSGNISPRHAAGQLLDAYHKTIINSKLPR
jgi:LAO/AO transport system kinase